MGDAGLGARRRGKRKGARRVRAACVVFARGAGDAVPFLSARLLAGRPVLHYTVAAARRARRPGAVYVSTEDERIASVARGEGAEVLLRPATLSKHETPLAAAIQHAADALVRRHPRLEQLVCVQADAVFCEAEVIDRALERLAAGRLDRVVAVLPEFKKLVVWREGAGGAMSPVVAPPHLRPKGGRLFSEPGLLTAWRLERGKVPFASPRVGHVAVEERQSFRVDTEYDLAVAERIVGPRRLALRCDGSPRMGMGHVLRMLSVARQLGRDSGDGGPPWIARFFVGSDHLEGARMLVERGVDVDVVRSGEVGHWVRRIEEYAPQVVVSDLPFVPAQYSELLLTLPAKVITLVDSLADIDPKTAELDTVISLMDQKLKVPHRRYHAGPSFAAFSPSVLKRIGRAASRRRRFPAGPLRLLLAFGTQDPLRLSSRALEALSGCREALREAAVVLPPAHQDKRFRGLAARFGRRIKVLSSPSDRMGELLARADAALVSGGITAYEASALGVPAVVLCQNEREQARMELFERSGSIVLLGRGDKVSPAQLGRALRRLAKDPALRRRLSAAGLRVSDGQGIRRISGLIAELLARKRTSGRSGA